MRAKQNYSINIDLYNGKISAVNKLKNLIISKYSEIFLCVIVHGSIASDEVINYSDFDGLLIVKDRYIKSNKLKKFLNESMKIILEFDPLQHHGWFQISESQLFDYPQTYLPYEILKHSKLVFPMLSQFSVDISVNQKKIDYSKVLESIILSIEKQSKSNFKKMRIYELKSFLSKIMLLPSIYYSVKYKKGIFKKQSFDLVKNDFTQDEWTCIEISSQIRQDWAYELNYFQKFVMTRTGFLFRRLTKKYLAPSVNQDFLNRLNEDFFESLNLLIKKISQNIMRVD